ncbi:plasma membrane iron permease [Tricharina praecox]|uniref:plasma membrane iron permease n=1 Tax=Tricharina praecox TaxID=43433 RepID=UPI00221FA826|nr:plasma membrane iron permease [Tricharina praecox]KAI5858338.1 plasma membrane iron permease [Tricharina praecox]
MGKNVFTVPVFFIVFRETFETSLVVGILLSLLKHTVGSDPALHKRLVRQVWAGTIAGLLICLVVGAGIIGAFYSLRKRELWSKSEDLYEGIFSLLASIIITLVGAMILRISKKQESWRAKMMAKGERGLKAKPRSYAMFILPLVTVLREGVEAVVFVGGIGLSEPASAFPLPVITALIAGSVIGWMVYRGGVTVGIKWFLIASTVVLYLVAAGLLSKAAWSFDMYEFAKAAGGEVSESGAGPGSYNIHHNVWHINCCSPKFNGGGGWGVFYAILGWQNSATYGSVLTYNFYWIVVSAWFIIMRFEERNGRYPFMKAREAPASPSGSESPPLGDVEKQGAKVTEATEVK